MADDLRERLLNNAKALDGLLSLIPSKMYYGEDTSDQWKKKKQTKAEAKAARRRKLDPDSMLNRSAKEVMDERARKRKIEEMEDESDSPSDESIGDIDGIEKEQPGQGLKKLTDEQRKKQKVTDQIEDEVTKEVAPATKKEAKMLEKKFKKQEKRAEKKTAKSEQPTEPPAPDATTTSALTAPPKPAPKSKHTQPEVTDVNGGSDDGEWEDESEENDDEAAHESSPGSGPVSPTFDNDDAPQKPPQTAETHSSTTSVNSTVEPSVKPRHIKLPDNREELKARLQARLAKLRAERGAGPDGKPIRTRQELIESRRAEQAKRKAHKKELRRKAKEEKDRQREEALQAVSARSSPLGAMSPVVHADATPNFSFGRVNFSDGTQMSRDLSYVLKNDKKKGPSDPKTALAKLENQKKKIEALDEDKRKEVLERETWLAARKRAEGEKVHDDTSKLKKAVKRKEQQKKKSAREWKERVAGVEKAQKEKQKKREENLKKRREEKGQKGKKKKKGGSGGKKSGGIGKGVPGFGGSLRVGGKRK